MRAEPSFGSDRQSPTARLALRQSLPLLPSRESAVVIQTGSRLQSSEPEIGQGQWRSPSLAIKAR